MIFFLSLTMREGSREIALSYFFCVSAAPEGNCVKKGT